MVVTAASDSKLYAAVLDGDTAEVFASGDGGPMDAPELAVRPLPQPPDGR